ncbi:MAG: outer membrane protein assembly factor BamA [Deltaproteobacteria bacterium]|nr:outer membrane protein assembly factor BamA [Deltaproteobacteria bacterium]
MFRKSLLIVVILLFWAVMVMAQEEIRVVILPFEVHAPEGLEDLRGQIRDLVEKQLADEGVTVIRPDEVEGPKLGADISDLDDLRTYGLNAGADFIIWGSFAKIGKRFSLDVNVMESYGDAAPEPVYVEGEGIETLLGAVETLAVGLGVKMLGREKVAEVIINGNKRIESEAIKRIVKTKEGDTYLPKHVQEDLKSIYKMGYFDDVRVEASSTQEGKIVTFQVVENETIRNISIKGNKKFDDEDIREVISVKAGSILNVNKLRGDIQQIESLYKEEGYHRITVTYDTKSVGENGADIDFVVEEGKKVFIKSISFEGNKAYDDDDIEDLMKTKKKGFFSFFTSAGDLDHEVLDQDVAAIAAYYHNHGYIEAKVSESKLTYEDEEVSIVIKIDEGPRFSVGQVDVEGDLIGSKGALLARIRMRSGTVYNREVIREDILKLQDIYSDTGYAYAQILPRIDQDLKGLKANITYVIDEGPVVYFERIEISGNTRTRDKVIRRELLVREQERFSGTRLKQGTRNLYRLEYFEDIQVNTTKGSTDDTLILNVDVTEKPTGAFSFGAGYSSKDQVFGVVSIAQRNLFGRGQILNARGQIGGTASTYSLSFTEPWLFDIPLSAGFDIYNTSRDYDTYDKDSIGGTLRGGYPVWPYTRLTLAYNYDKSDIGNLTFDASSSIREFAGENVSHTVTALLRRDSRDRIFNPSRGSDNSITIQHAGTPFGGDIGYTKYVGDSGWYHPLFWYIVGYLHGRIGYIHDDPVGEVPTWERFYLGGMETVRGYGWRDISPRDPITFDKIGGDKMILFNAELIFPIIRKAGLVGVVFFDTGNTWADDDTWAVTWDGLRKSTGFGVRWYSPMGPLRLEYGYILDEELRGEGGWEFSMGMAM